jgi:hypothetical protein
MTVVGARFDPASPLSDVGGRKISRGLGFIIEDVTKISMLYPI